MKSGFINIDGTNYFVITEDKTIEDIYKEIIGRMDIRLITHQKRREILHQIKQAKNGTSRTQG